MKSTVFSSLSGLVALLVIFIAFNVLNSLSWSGARLDLTENRQYSLSAGTRNLLAHIDEPIKLELFFSEESSQQIPAIRAYAARIKDVLNEYRLAANGKLRLEFVDPAPFSAQEDRAAELGLQAVPIGQNGTSTLYMGLVGTNSLDSHQTIAFFQPDKETQLEYQLSKLIYQLNQTRQPVVAVLSGLPVAGGIDPMQRSSQPAWTFYDQLQQRYQMRTLTPDLTQLDDDLDLLILIQPSGLTESALFAIDQYVLRGGKLIVMADPYPEMVGAAATPLSDLSRLYKAWGVSVNTRQLLLDNQYALKLQTARDKPPIRHLGLLGLTEAALNLTEVYSTQLERINLGSSGVIARLPGTTGIEFFPLLQSSADSMLLDKEHYLQVSPPELLQNQFVSAGQVQVLAARIQGKFSSAFSANPDASAKQQFLSASSAPAQILLFADTDWLSDRMWVQIQGFLNQKIAIPFASNGDLLANAVDSFTGAADLIGIRGRERLERPFKRIQALRQQAELQFAQSQKALEAKLQATERQLVDLQSQQQKDAAMVLNPEQEKALQGFQAERLKIRKELRDVRHQLDKDINALGSWLKALNLGLMPALLVLVALLVGWGRRRAS